MIKFIRKLLFRRIIIYTSMHVPQNVADRRGKTLILHPLSLTKATNALEEAGYRVEYKGDWHG